jgi:hypothetical protein
MTAVITLLDRFQNVVRVVLAVAESLDAAGLGSCGRCRAWLFGVIGMGWVVWPLGRDNLDAPLVEGC